MCALVLMYVPITRCVDWRWRLVRVGSEAGNFPLIKIFDRQLKRSFDLQSIIEIRQHDRMWWRFIGSL